MKKYLVIGNPIEHSLSPELHNFWIKKNNIKADYNKRKINKDEIKSLILNVRDKKINGVPFFEIGTDFFSGAQSSANLESTIRSNLS